MNLLASSLLKVEKE